MKFITVISLSFASAAVAVLAGHHPPQTCHLTQPSSSPWQTLPPTPSLDGLLTKTGFVPTSNSAQIWYGLSGPSLSYSLGQLHQAPLVFLHGGLANSDWFAHQVRCLSPFHTMLSVDFRGHGRSYGGLDTSNGNGKPGLTHDTLAKDVITVLDFLNIPKANFIGWSDGGTVALDIALNYPQRVAEKGIFAFGAVHDAANGRNKTAVLTNSVVKKFQERTFVEYQKLNPQKKYTELVLAVSTMWAIEPKWTRESFQSAQEGLRVFVEDGEEEDVINRGVVQTLHGWINGSQLTLLPKVSHFALIQDPSLFNSALLGFLA